MLIALGGGIVVGLSVMAGVVLLFARFEHYGPAPVGIGVVTGFIIGVFTGTKLFRRRTPPAT